MIEDIDQACSVQLRWPIGALAALILLPVLAVVVRGEPRQRVYVSATKGSDHARCTASSPCLSIQHALDPQVVLPGGEIVVLDSGDYEPFTISNSAATPAVTSVTVEAAPGVLAGITADSGNAITIQAGVDDTVILRGLILYAKSSSIGINFLAGRTLHVESCIANGFLAGLLVSRNLPGDTAEVFVKDSIFRNGQDGIDLFNPGSGSAVKASIDTCRLERNGLVVNGPRGGAGIAGGNARVTIRNSLAANNGFGFTSEALFAGNSAEMSLENCVAANNFVAVAVGSVGPSLIRLSNSTVTDNEFGLSIGPNGTLLSRGNNTVEGNGSGNAVPAGSTFSPK